MLHFCVLVTPAKVHLRRNCATRVGSLFVRRKQTNSQLFTPIVSCAMKPGVLDFLEDKVAIMFQHVKVIVFLLKEKVCLPDLMF